MSTPNTYTNNNFFVSDLDQRRAFFIESDPKFEELEKTLFSKFPKIKNQRLIYMPEMLEASFYMDGSSFCKLDTHNKLNFKGQCHQVSYELYNVADESDRVEIFHGFYLIDNLWRLHSWIKLNDSFVDGTGNKSVIAYGRQMEPALFERIIL